MRCMPRISTRPVRSTRSFGTRRSPQRWCRRALPAAVDTNPRTVGASIGASACSRTCPLPLPLPRAGTRATGIPAPGAPASFAKWHQSLRQRRQALGQVDQEFDSLLAVGLRQFLYHFFELRGHGKIPGSAWNDQSEPSKGSTHLGSAEQLAAPLAIGARTRLPHSSHEPS